ncbi:ethanolamine utilization microcompartment protein EutL [Anaerolineae bacterium CFX7]|nr:ethanolamine utilization microcompartment protein EutL [Anaerolineae bacterium CFX7]RIK25410.1 MAG: microcompartment protein EutL [Chloroflexota bacterium]
MAILDPIKANVLAVRLIPNVDRGFAEKINLRADERCIGFLTADIDDATYTAIDEATKQADVRVAYAKSFYAGSGHASGPLSGEIIAILAGPDPAEVRAGLNAALTYIRDEAYFYSANDDNSIAFFPHLISRTGSYLSDMAGVPLGTPMAYLIAPPLEATFGIDAALKAANVTMRVWFNPPSETNFSGALLTGDQAACRAACRAFQEAVLDVAKNPLKF